MEAAVYHLEMAFMLPVAIVPYLLPAIIAVGRRHHRTADIVAINCFLGWTIIGWLVAYRIALSPVIPDPTPRRPPQREPLAVIDEEQDMVL